MEQARALTEDLRLGKLSTSSIAFSTSPEACAALGSAGYPELLGRCIDTLSAEQCRLAVKVARNVCAQNPKNQLAVWNALSEPLLRFARTPSCGVDLRVLALQVLTNACVGHAAVQELAWKALYPTQMLSWLKEVDEIAIVAAALTGACLASDHARRTALVQSVNALEFLSALLTLAERDSLSSSQLLFAIAPLARLLNDSLLPLLCAALPSAPVRAQLFRLAAALLESGDVQPEAVLTDANADWLLRYMEGAQHGELLSTQLQFLSEVSASLSPARLHLTRRGLVPFLLSLLRLLPLPSARAASPLSPDSPASSLRQEVLRTLANVLYDNVEAKDALSSDGLLLLLSQAVLDPTAPHAREWALFAVRNAVTDHVANSAVVASLRQDTVLQSEQLADAGLRVVVRNGKLRLEPAAGPEKK